MPTLVLTLVHFFRGARAAWHRPGFRATFTLAAIALVSGTLFYWRIEGWRPLDALYFCVMTLTTIGYGDLHPTSDISKVFTMVYALAGIGVFVAMITQVAQAQVEVREPPDRG